MRESSETPNFAPINNKKYDLDMIKKLLLSVLVCMFLTLDNTAHAGNGNYDFSAKAPSGQTLYYKLINNDKEVEVVKSYKQTYKGNIIIPDTVEYMGVQFPVTRIGEFAFNGCSSVISVKLPSTIREIANWAFRGTSISTIEFPNSLKSIGSESFENTHLTKIEIPQSIEFIGENAFVGCVIKKVVVLCKHARIGKDVFSTRYSYGNYGNNDIEEAYFEEYIDIPKKSLKKLTFGNGVYSIPTSFKDCDKLEKVVIGDNILSIPADCFDGCDNLRIVILGNRVGGIGDRAFRMCASLDTVYAKRSNAPALGTNFFNFTPSSKVVVINCESDYASVWGTEGFKYTTQKVYNLSLGVDCPSCGSASFKQKVDCNNTAIIEATPRENYTFAKWSDGNTNNPRTITLTHNMTLEAVFTRSVYNVTVKSNNSTMGSVSGGGKCNEGDRVTLTANAICGYRFNHWSDGSKENPRSFVSRGDANLTAFFEIALDTIFVPDTTLAKIVIYDTTIVDVPAFDTMRFREPDNSLVPMHNVLLTVQDTIYMRDSIKTDMGDNTVVSAKVYINNGCIVAEGVQDEYVELSDTDGRVIASKKKENDGFVRFDVPSSGVYHVRIGDQMIRNVVVIK